MRAPALPACAATEMQQLQQHCCKTKMQRTPLLPSAVPRLFADAYACNSVRNDIDAALCTP